MPTTKKKRDVPSTPTRKGAEEQQPVASPTKPPEKKKPFTGATAMDEDIGPRKMTPEEERESRRLEREARKQRIERQKLTGTKEKGGKTTGADVDDEETVNSGTKKDAAAKNSRGRKSDVGVLGGKQVNASKPRGRARSVPPPQKTGRGGSRATSVDSAVSRASRKNDSSSSSDSSASTPKRKKNTEQTDSGKKKTTKTAKFDESILDNTGKTASTKKSVRAKKKETYAEKTNKDKKKEWIYQTVIEFKTRVFKCNKPTTEMYSRMGNVHRIFQTIDPECAIGDHMNAKAEPIRSPGEYTWSSHATWMRHFVLDEEKEWQWDKVSGDKPRNFAGSFILLSDKPAQEIMNFVRVDMRNAFQGIIRIKQMQELHTSLDFILLGVHANTHSDIVGTTLRMGLVEAESNALERKQLFESEGLGVAEWNFQNLDKDWKTLDFPEIVCIRSYPKAGPYEESKSNEDTSWKMAHHFQVADVCRARFEAALLEFRNRGGLKYYFGSEALLFSISEKLRLDGKDEYNKLIVKHQNINRSVGGVTLPGAIDIDEEVTMFFEPEQEGKVRNFRRMTLRDIIKKIYVKISGRKIPVFLYCFKTPNGKYQLWFWDTVTEIREFVEMFSTQGAAYIWHRCRLWGWEFSSMKRLFSLSFDSMTATSAMNSKWCAKRNKAVHIQMSAEAAAELSFGNSPFVLKEGEDKASRQQKEKAIIQRGNIKPDEIGGVDADDLQSVGDESNAETIFISDEDEEEYEDYEDDDVSMMSDNEGFDEDGDESTVQREYSESEEDDEMEDMAKDEDSAFSTKAGLDGLAAKGRKIGNDDAAAAAWEEEKAAAKRVLAEKAKEMEDFMAALKVKEEALNKALRMAESRMNDAAAPGAAGGDAEGGENSQEASASSASAAIK